jgi:hypothetical protein
VIVLTKNAISIGRTVSKSGKPETYSRKNNKQRKKQQVAEQQQVYIFY